MQRQVQPELLDQLPATDPAAIRSRQDLRRVNAWMGHPRLAKKLFEKFSKPPPWRIVELGSGDGTFLLRVAHLLGPKWEQSELTLVDQQNIIEPETLAEFKRIGWK